MASGGDPGFDDRQYVYTVDISVIATGFGQRVDLGTIDADTKPVTRARCGARFYGHARVVNGLMPTGTSAT